MLLLRLLVLSVCLAATGWYLHGQQRAGRLQRVDDLFLDFLAANARERLTAPDPAAADQVVLVLLREEDKAEYGAWPPPPLDWQTILKSLQVYEPSVVVITTPLTWGHPAPDFVPAVAESLRPFASVVLGVEAELAEARRDAPAFMGDLGEVLPRFSKVDGEAVGVPRLAALITAPDKPLRSQAEMGLLSARRAGEAWLLPYAVREGEDLLPTVLAQTLARESRSPYSLQRLRLGPGAGAYLREGRYIPLDPSGQVRVTSGPEVPTVNALHLMTGTLADGTDAADKAALGKGRIIVIGTDRESGEGPRLAWLNARALAQVLSLPRMRMLSPAEQSLAWGLAAVGAAWLVVRVRRSRALVAGALLVFVALLGSYVLFQSQLLWFPPTMPAALLAAGAVVGLLLGRKNPAAAEGPPAPPQP
jgi:CHASE2 domain-containing sensor protein